MKKLHILFDASNLIKGYNVKNSRRSGIYWAAYNLLKQFCLCKDFDITLLTSPCSFAAKRYIKKNFRYISGIITWYDKSLYQENINEHTAGLKKTENIIKKSLRVLKIIKNLVLYQCAQIHAAIFGSTFNRFDIYFSPVFSPPDVIRGNKSIIKIMVLYDCIPVLFKDMYPHMDTNDWFSKVVQNLNKDTYYFCISECTKRDFLKIAPAQLEESKMAVTKIAASQTFYPRYNKEVLAGVLEKYGFVIKPDMCYTFSLCNIEPRKNLLFTIKCFIAFIKKHRIENMYFLLGGASFPYYSDLFKQQLAGFSAYQSKIVFLGYVDGGDVNILYSNSLFFTCLSQYEGFGMPPLEAMQSGTPVICSNNSSLPEVVGDAAVAIAYNDEEACIKAFEDFYFNKSLRDEYTKKGLEQGKLFSWENTFELINEKITNITKERM